MDDNSESESQQQLVVFSYASPFHEGVKLSERIFTVGGRDLRLQQQYKSDGKGGTSIGFGASVYDCSFVSAHYLAENPYLVRDKVVVELGCGPGLASLGAAIAGAAFTIATDGGEESVELAQHNVALNVPTHKIHCRRLWWGNPEDIRDVQELVAAHRSVVHNATMDPGAGNTDCFPDIIIAADVIALPYEESYQAFVDTLVALSNKSTLICLCYQTRHASEQRCFELLSEKFELHRLTQKDIHADFLHRPISLYLLKLR